MNKKLLILFPLIALTLSACGVTSDSSSGSQTPSSSQSSSQDTSSQDSSDSSSEESSSSEGGSSELEVRYTITFVNSLNFAEKYVIGDISEGTLYEFGLPTDKLTAPKHRIFDYWSVDNTKYLVGDTLNIDSDVTAYAMWVKGYNNIKFTYGDGSGDPIDLTVLYDSQYTLPTFEEVHGQAPQYYLFKNWLVGEEEYEPGTILDITNNTIINANYELNAYRLTFVANNGSEDTTITYLPFEESSFQLPKCAFTAPAGKVFKSWLIDENEYADDVMLNNITTDLTITAVWEDIPEAEAIRTLHLENLDDNGDQLTLIVTNTTNPNGFLWPTSAESRDYDIVVTGTYLYEETNGCKSLYPFKYTMSKNSWNSYFVSNSLNWRVTDFYVDKDQESYNAGDMGIIINGTNFRGVADQWHDPVLGTIPYTVTIDLNNKDDDSDIFNISNVPGGDYLLNMADYASHDITPPPHKTFVKWDKIINDEHVEYYSDNTKVYVHSNVTFKAIWIGNEYTITLNDNGGTGGQGEIKAIYDQELPVVNVPNKDGDTFSGYYTSNNVQYYDETGTPTRNWDIGEDTTLYAKWIEGNKVTFNMQGHGEQVETQYVLNDTAILSPTDPTATGYTFDGWYLEADCINKWDFETTITDPLELFAKWTINQYTITFDTDGGSIIDPITQDYNTDIVAPAKPTKDGYVFDKWDQEIPSKMPAENITLTAIWNEIPKVESIRTMVLENLDGNGDTITLLVTATTNPNGFLWPDAQETRDYDIVVTGAYLYEAANGDLTLYSFKYTMLKNSWTSVFVSNSVDSRVTDFYVSGDETDPLYEQFEAGDMGVTIKGITFRGAMNRWHDPVLGTVPYTVTIDLNNKDDDSDIIPISNVPGGDFLLNLADYDAYDITAPEGKSFSNWDELINDVHVDYYDDNTKAYIYSDVTYKVIWVGNEYTITFDDGEGVGGPGEIKVTFGEDLPDVDTPSKDGYTFSGYYTVADVQYYDEAGKATKKWDIADDTTLYAKWIEGNKVTFNMQGHGEQVDNQYVLDDGVVLEPTAPTATGYTFGGWYLEADCTNQWNFETTISDPLELFAKWNVAQYTITYNLNGGTNDDDNPNEYNIASEDVTLNSPTKDGYVFAGWIGTDLADATKEVTITSGSTGNRTYTALWTIDVPEQRILRFVNASETGETLVLYLQTNANDDPWVWDVFATNNYNSEEITGTYIYTDVDGTQTFKTFTYSCTDGVSAFGGAQIASQDGFDYNEVHYDLKAIVGETIFGATEGDWHDAIIGKTLEGQIASGNQRVTKYVISTETHNLYLFVETTDYKDGFVFPDMSEPVHVTGKYYMVNKSNGQTEVYKFKYQLGGYDGPAWESHFESSTVNGGAAVVFEETDANGSLHTVINEINSFWVEQSDWQLAVLGEQNS